MASTTDPSSTAIDPSTTWLTGFWKCIFLFELPLCLVTTAYWLLAPHAYLASIDLRSKKQPVTPMEFNLLLFNVNLVFCAYILFYGMFLIRIVWRRDNHTNNPHTRLEQQIIFRFLQIAMGVGDVIVIASSLHCYYHMKPVSVAMLIVQSSIAAFFLIIRLIFVHKQAPAIKSLRKTVYKTTKE
jgi:hypothetical protein